MSRSAGGRGKKAPYSTTHVRVPEPIKTEVIALIHRFHQEVESETQKMDITLPDALAIAKGILLQKKSARVSMEKLLTALYHTEIKL